jgi:ribonuclease inhibitor
MRHCTLYLDDIKDKQSLHARLKGALMFPDYYGGNLDALNDCLTDLGEETAVVVHGYDALAGNLGGYAITFRSVLEHAAEENGRLTVTFL